MKKPISTKRAEGEDFLDFISKNGPHFELPGHIFVKDFEDIDLMLFTESMLQASNDPKVKNIHVWISSYGGSVDNVFAMIDLISYVKKPIYTIGYGKAMSAGCLLLASGNKGMRYATQKTNIMFHTVSAGTTGRTADVVKAADDIKRTNDQVLKELARATGKTLKDIKDLLKEELNTDIFLSAKQAKKFGIVDHIGLPASIFLQEPQQKSQSQPEEQFIEEVDGGQTPVFSITDIVRRRIRSKN